jgi:hypothetical protein
MIILLQSPKVGCKFGQPRGQVSSLLRVLNLYIFDRELCLLLLDAI